MLEEINNFNNKLENFTYQFIPASRNSTRGHASGGCLFAFKKCLTNCINFKYLNNLVYFEIVDSVYSRYNIVPIYLNCNNWLTDYLALFDALSDLSCNRTMIIGDFNARTGDKESFISFNNVKRQSVDSVTNNEGKKILDLCNSYGFAIVNGCTSGDFEGNYTFIGGNGCSVIDYCLVGSDWENKILDFSIMLEDFSDHLPLLIEVSFNLPDYVLSNPENNLRPKLLWSDKIKNRYNLAVDARINAVEGVLSLAEIDSLIQESYYDCHHRSRSSQQKEKSQREPWFDKECETKRAQKFAWLKVWRRERSVFFIKEFRRASKELKELCNIKKRQYALQTVVKFCNARDSTSFWKLAKEINGKKTYSNPVIEANVFKTYFDTLLNPTILQIKYYGPHPIVVNDELDRGISEQELNFALNNCREGKAPGINRIPSEFYKYGTATLRAMLLTSFNSLFEEGEVPEDQLKAIIFPLHKKGSKNEVTNYRGITFLNSSLKIFTSILHHRLSKWVEDNNILSQFQAGFRKQHSTVDQIFNITSICQLYIEKRTKLYLFFVDFKTAFDHIQRDLLFYKLSQKGVSTKFLTILKALYKNTSALVWNGQNVSDDFCTEFGIKQGCNISPLLFSLFIDDLNECLGGGIKIDNIPIKLLLYADDLVLLAEYPATLQRMINKLEEYCLAWGLTVNISKSQIMIVREENRGRYANCEKWTYGRQSIEIVKEYYYLGVKLTSNMKFERHVEWKVSEAKAAMAVTWKNIMLNNKISVEAKHKVFQSTSSAIALYADACWGFKKIDYIESLQRYYIKRIYKLPSTTPNYILALETGLPDMYLTTLKHHFEFIVKLLTSSQNKLSKKIAQYVVQRKVVWFKKWFELANEIGSNLTLDITSPQTWLNELHELLNQLHVQNLHRYHSEACSSSARVCYPVLNHFLSDKSYFNRNYSIHKISTICKIRGELWQLNYMAHRPDLPSYCSLCNLREHETVIHFLGKCPILREIRKVYFGVVELNINEVYEILNGKDWNKLYNYCLEAFKYRYKIVNELF